MPIGGGGETDGETEGWTEGWDSDAAAATAMQLIKGNTL